MTSPASNQELFIEGLGVALRVAWAAADAASGTPAYFAAADAAVALANRINGLEEDLYGVQVFDEGPSCSICDGLGHGYPGGAPCPLEERGYWEARADEER
jgi:hypothetical protein